VSRRFVIEAVMVAIYGQLLVAERPVEYIIPYTTILELYDMKESNDPVMPDEDEDKHVKEKISELIAYFEDPFNKKKLEKMFSTPWKKSSPMLVNDQTSFTVIYAVENAQYGELLDPVETELILTSIREQAPLLTDQFEFINKIIEGEIAVEAYDIEDFEYAIEEDNG
jgi:hypothetical protein